MSRPDAKSPATRTFWATWQAVVAVPGVLLIGWKFVAREESQPTGGQALGVWSAIFIVATVAGLLRARRTR
ncbi:hypothetical protein Q7C18_01440 [Nesterenkonia sp. CL21]|uniref:hypothetical protein n=1 Tax=Nesterenkonia sp. CL21 TaxID=3064894 RepID=UPI0028787AC8|nr:hypothetical protein [Nesterenkonia sp. CL21]MDS2171360.1 hypothetical protein [Nesterenkonia sp. CL21]